jgi:hypothetical protein
MQQRETQLLKRRNELDGLLGSSTRRLEALLRREQRKRYPLGTLYFIAFGVAILYLALSWWLNIPYGWFGFWGFAGILVLYLLLLPTYRGDSDVERILAIRAAAASGNADIAPLAADQPSLTDGQPQQALYLGPLMRTAKRRDTDWNLEPGTVLAGGIPLFAGIMTLLIAVSEWPDIGRSLLSTAFSLVFLLPGLYHLSPSLFHLYYRKHPPRDETLMLSQDGIAWQRSGTPKMVQWEAIRSVCVEQSRLANFGRRTFIIDAVSDVFAWTIAPDASEAEQAASDEALRLIMGRTSLPFRDISDVVERLLQDGDRPQGRWSWQVHAPFAYAASVLLTALLIAAGISALLTQQQAYQTHLAGILAQPPLFADAMTANNGLWPVDTTYGSAIYTNGSYVLTNKQSGSLYELRPQTYGDITLAVTERLDSSDEYAQAGLVLRAHLATDTFLTWGITPAGEWWLEDGPPDNPHDIEIVSSSAIHTAYGASNRLVAIMRGNAYTFFINGHWVGSYLIASLTSGRVGIFLGLLAESGSFNDFAVYRTPPLSWNNWLFLA